MAEAEEVDICLDSYDYFFRPDLLRGKVAFITGGGSGIGFRIAEVFMRHECDTVIASRNLKKLEKAAEKLERCTGRKCLPVQLDVRNPEQVIAGVDKALKHFSKIDILVNGSAGNFLCPADKLTYNGFKTVISIDTLGTFNVTKALFDKCFKDNGGSIINISATLQYTGNALQTHAGVAKAGIDALTRHLCVEWGEYGIRVNSLAPGPIEDTEGFRRLGGSSLKENDMTRHIPVQRLGSSRDIADASLYLASGASSYVSGACLVVDGGAWMTLARSMAGIRKLMSKL